MKAVLDPVSFTIDFESLSPIPPIQSDPSIADVQCHVITCACTYFPPSSLHYRLTFSVISEKGCAGLAQSICLLLAVSISQIDTSLFPLTAEMREEGWVG